MKAPSLLYFFGLTVAAVLAGGLPAVAASLDDAERADVDHAVRSVMHENNIPGVSIALVRDCAVVYAQAYGVAKVSAPRLSARPQTRFAIGSITKEFVAAAILLLADRGK